jgi:hypothetical protein
MGSAVGDVDDIDFDDLTSPKLTDIQRQILEFTEAKHVDFDIERMLADAIDQASVGDDLDDTDGFGDRLTAHVVAIEADHGLTQLTRSSLRQRVVRLLRNRLSPTDLIKRYPEIESIQIEKPFIVVGMPRSGTTREGVERYRFLTPDQLIAEVRSEASATDYGPIVLHPLVGGMPVDEAWKSVQLLADKVPPVLI